MPSPRPSGDSRPPSPLSIRGHAQRLSIRGRAFRRTALRRAKLRPPISLQELTLLGSILLALFLPALLPVACGKQGPSHAAINRAIQTRVTHDDHTIAIAGDRLIESKAVAHFYR